MKLPSRALGYALLRITLGCGLVILALTAGLTISGASAGVANNLVFALVIFLLLYFIEENQLLLDSRGKRPESRHHSGMP